jgi:serine/threonine protein kinase KIN1/2
VPIECKDLLSRILVADPLHRATLSEVINHPWIVKGYDSPPINLIPSRDPVALPLNDEVLNKMTGFNFPAPEAIKKDLIQIIESEVYQRAVTRLQSERYPTGEPQLAKEAPIKRILSLYKKHKPSISNTKLNSLTNFSTELSARDDPLYAFDPLISMYCLAREKCNKERG